MSYIPRKMRPRGADLTPAQVATRPLARQIAAAARLMGGLPLTTMPGIRAVAAPGRIPRLPFSLGYRLRGKRMLPVGLPWRRRATQSTPGT